MSEGVSKELLMRRRNLATPHKATASGAVASFSTDMAVPLKSCQFSIEPVQSGSGDPSPSNVRPISGWTGANGYHAKKNLLPASIPSNIISADFDNANTIRIATNAKVFAIPVPPNTDIYVQKKSGNTNGHNLGLGDTGNIAVGTSVYEVSGFTNLNGKQYNTGNHTWLYIKSSSQTVAEEIFTTSEFMVSVGTTRQEYVAPYTGNQISVTFPAQGKNLFNKDGVIAKDNIYVNASLEVKTGTGNKGFIIPISEGGDYTLSIPLHNVTDIQFASFTGEPAAGDEATARAAIGITSTSISATVTAGANDKYLFVKYNYATVEQTYTDAQILAAVQIEKGSSATAYEPYTNTVYGGTVDVTTGVLTVTWAAEDMGDLSWTGVSDYFRASVSPAKAIGITNIICTCYPTSDSTSATQMANKSIKGYDANNYIYAKDTDYETGTAFRAAVTGQKIIYELATPVTYQLTPQQITALKGQNNVWCDTGNTTVTYWKH